MIDFDTQETFGVEIISQKAFEKCGGEKLDNQCKSSYTLGIDSADTIKEKVENVINRKSNKESLNTIKKSINRQQNNESSQKKTDVTKNITVAEICDNTQNEHKELKSENSVSIVSTQFNEKDEFPYKKVSILSSAELQTFNFLKNYLCLGCNQNRIEILTKVRLADIICLDTEKSKDNSYTWKITNKHIDYCICEKGTMNVICVIELDDNTHNGIKAESHDLFIMEALMTAGINVFRIQTKVEMLSRRDLRLAEEEINKYFAPQCIHCHVKMIPKENFRTKGRFYACPDNINCRYTIPIDDGEKLPNI